MSVEFELVSLPAHERTADCVCHECPNCRYFMIDHDKFPCGVCLEACFYQAKDAEVLP